MDDDINEFLLVFNRLTGVCDEIREFGTDSEAALEAYAAAERTYGDSECIEVVLIGSDSLDTIRVTHANYVAPTGTESKFFAGLRQLLAASGGPRFTSR